MRCTGNARVIVADGLLALPGELLFRQVEVSRDKLPEVRFDGFLILRCRGNDLGIENGSLVVGPITMVEDATRRFGAPIPCCRAGLKLHGGALRLLIPGNDPQRFVACIEDLDAANNDALKWIATLGRKPGRSRCVLRLRREPVKVQVVAGQWPYEVRAALLEL